MNTRIKPKNLVRRYSRKPPINKSNNRPKYVTKKINKGSMKKVFSVASHFPSKMKLTGCKSISQYGFNLLIPAIKYVIIIMPCKAKRENLGTYRFLLNEPILSTKKSKKQMRDIK